MDLIKKLIKAVLYTLIGIAVIAAAAQIFILVLIYLAAVIVIALVVLVLIKVRDLFKGENNKDNADEEEKHPDNVIEVEFIKIEAGEEE